MCSEWVSAGGWLVIADGEVLIGWNPGEGGRVLFGCHKVLGSWCLVWMGVYWMRTVVVDKQRRLIFLFYFFLLSFPFFFWGWEADLFVACWST